MSGPATGPEEQGPPPARRSRALRIALWAGAALLTVIVLLAAAVLGLNTGPGRTLLASEIASLDLPGGLRLHVGRIDGSIYGRMVLRDVSVDDTRGLLATSPAITLDWDPAALAGRRVQVNLASADLIRLLRQPALRPSGPKTKAPNITVAIDRLAVTSLVLEPPVAGQRRAVGILASAEMVASRIRLDARAQARDMAGRPTGDVVLVKLDADPDANRLQLAAHAAGPKGGVIDGLLKLDAPLAFDIAGRGDWRDWRGRATAAVGGAPALDAALLAQNGRFAAAGTAHPDLIVKSLARLSQPAVRFDVAATVGKQRVTVQGRVSSGQFAAAATGAVDRAHNAFQALRIQASLLDPSALSASLSGRDVRLALVLDGPFARPTVDYDFTAASLGYGAMSARAVRAHGRSTRSSDGSVLIPVQLAAAEITGVAKQAPPLTDVSLDGPVTIERNGAVAADLRLRSTRLDASLTLKGSQRTGAYQGALHARLDAVAVKQLGLEPTLGAGPATASADFARSTKVALAVSNLRLEAPLLRITSGQATYFEDGRLNGAVSAVSTTYGPLQLTVDGARNALHAHLVAPNPKLAVPVTQVQADLAQEPGGYRLTAKGASPYGPLTLDSTIRTGPGTLALDLRRAQLGGLVLAGQVARTAEGPFAGSLVLTGDGLNGNLRLTGQGKVQAAALDLRAADASLPLAPPVLVQSGHVVAQAVLYPGAPSFSGRADLAGVSRAGMSLETVRFNGAYQHGEGRATLAAAGDTGAPFKLNARARMTPGEVLVDGQGTVSGVPLRLAHTAEVQRQGAAWRLLPATLVLPSGQVVLAGSYGQGATLSAQLQNLDLRLARVISPSLGLSGKVSGDADLAAPQGGAPTGKLALQVTGLTRTGATTVSQPVDINVLGELAGSAADARAVLRQRGAVLGRLQAHLAMPAGGGFTQRLQAGQLSGGLRYQGPADALLSVTGVSGQELKGPVAIGADVSGRLDQPQVHGVLLGSNLTYENAKYGTRVTGIAVDGRFTGPRFELVKLTGSTAGHGSLSASGYADLSAAHGWPIDLTVKLDKAQLAQGDNMGARMSGSLAITNSRAKGPLVAGDLALDNARYEVTHTGGGETADLEGVHWKGHPLAPPGEQAASGPPSRWRLNIKVHAPNQIFVDGMGLTSEWRADLRVLGDLQHPRVVGDVRSVRGSYTFAGRRFTLNDSVIHFDGSEPPNPTLDINASAQVNTLTANVAVSGTATQPEIAFSSTPALPEDEVLSEVLFGGPTAQLSPVQALQLAASLNALRGGGGGLDALGKLTRATGLQNLRFAGANAQTGQGPSIGAGRYITNKIYVDVITDARGYTATQVEVALTQAFSVLSQISTFGGTSAALRYTHRY